VLLSRKEFPKCPQEKKDFMESEQVIIDQKSHDSSTSQYGKIVEVESPAHGSMLSSWTVMAKTMIGVGLLGLSAATAYCGWVLGMVLLFVAGAAAMFTLHLLNSLIMQSNKRHVSFYSVAEKYAPWSRWVVDVAIAIKSLGVGTAYFQVYGTQMTKFILSMNPSIDKTLSHFTLRLIVILVGLVFMVPVCFRKSVSKTAIINVCGIVGITYIVILGCLYTDVSYSITGTSLWPTGTFVDIASKIPIYIFTFTCHQNMFLVGEDLKDRSQKKLDTVAILAEVVGIMLFLPAMICPYLTYGSSVKGNFLDSMTDNPEIKSDIAVLCGSLAIAVAEISAFPLQLFPCRKSTMVLVTRGGEISVSLEKKLRRTLTAIILCVTCIISIFVSDLGLTLSIVGAVGSNTICFIMPTFLYCRAFPRIVDSTLCKRSSAKWYASACVCVVSTLLLPICLTATIYTAVMSPAASGH
jgi:amino acid permease